VILDLFRQEIASLRCLRARRPTGAPDLLRPSAPYGVAEI